MAEIVINPAVNSNAKYRKLILCFVLDFVGYLSYVVPFFGEFTDVIWAPIAAFLTTKMFKGSIGKVGGVFAFIEEIMPGIDFIPTFTITWIYSNLVQKK